MSFCLIHISTYFEVDPCQQMTLNKSWPTCTCTWPCSTPDNIITARKRSLEQGNIFQKRVKNSVHMGWGAIPACIAGGIPEFFAGIQGWYPSMLCRSPGPHPTGKLKGLVLGGSPGPHPRGSPIMHPTKRRLLLLAVSILLECILICNAIYWFDAQNHTKIMKHHTDESFKRFLK